MSNRPILLSKTMRRVILSNDKKCIIAAALDEGKRARSWRFQLKLIGLVYIQNLDFHEKIFS